MLYNPKWERKKPDPMALTTFISWLERQRPDKEYSYWNGLACPLAKYFRSQGYWWVIMGPYDFVHFFRRTKLPPVFDMIVVRKPHTFGAALERARKRQFKS